LEEEIVIMKKILVGFDDSEGSKQALNRAQGLIDDEGEIFLLAVVPSSEDKVFVEPGVHKEMKKKAQALVDETIENIGSQNFTIKGMVEEGDAASKIIDAANKLDVDLIVLGSRGNSEIGRFLIGSVANKVVQYAHKPVMLVR
jgi:nucleotide-binding universal stress UspA family protein